MTESSSGFVHDKPQYERARGVLELQVRQGSTRREATQHLVEDLLQFDLPIAARYKYLDVIRILRDNCALLDPGLDALMRGLSILERYGKNLLRSERPPQWRVVRFSNNIFKQEVDVIKGARDILKLLGYSKTIDDGLSYPDDCLVPDTPLVASVTADILLLRQELLMLASKEHPQEGRFYSYVAAEQISAVQTYFEQQVKPKMPDTPTRTSVSGSSLPNSFASFPKTPSYNEVLAGAGKKLGFPLMELEEQDSQRFNHIESPSVPQEIEPETNDEVDEDELCDICGQNKSMLKCRKCEKIFCPGCNKIWHSNPKRKNHAREIVPIEQAPSDVPERSTPSHNETNSANLSNRSNLPNGSLSGVFSPSIPHGQEQVGPGNNSYQPTLSGERLRPTLNSQTSSLNEDSELSRKVNRMAAELMDISNSEVQKAKLLKCLKELDKEADKYKGGINQLMSKGSETPSLVAHFQEKVTKIEDIKTQFKTLCNYEDPPEDLESLSQNEFSSRIPSEGGWSFRSVRSQDDVVPSNRNDLAKRPKLSSEHETQVTVANLIDFSPDVNNVPVVVNASGFRFNSQTSEAPLDLRPTSSSQLNHVEDRATSAAGDLDEVTLVKSTGVPGWGDAPHENALSGHHNSMSAIEDPDLRSVFSVPSMPVQPTPGNHLKRNSPNFQNGVAAKIQCSEGEGHRSNIPMISSELEKLNFKTQQQKIDEAVKVQPHEFTEPIDNTTNDEDFHSAMEIQPAINRLEDLPTDMTPLVPTLSPKELQDRIRKEELRFQTTQFLDLIRAGDSDSFRPEQVEVALTELEKEGNLMRSTPNSWLERKWTGHVKSFIAFVKEKGIKITFENAEDVLLEGGQSFERAHELILDAQNEQVSDLVTKDHGFEEAKRALMQCKGDKDLASAHLQKGHLLGIYKELDEVEADDESDMGLLKQIIDIEDTERKNHALSAILDFDQTSRAETLNALLNALPNDMMTMLIADAIEALTENDVHDVDTALHYLDNECMICMDKFPRSKITCLPTCGDKGCMYCISCLEQHLTICVRDKNIRDIICPVCSLPETNSDEDTLLNFFSHIDAVLRRIPDKKIHEMYQQKTRDFTLMRLPNFRWCSHCSGGFQYENEVQNNRKMVCPFCTKATCYECKRQWEPQHDGITCEEFKKWKESNDPEFQAAGLARHLKENGIDCPDCGFRYALAKGGCMHFKCTQCSHEFCSGCYSPFKTGINCGRQLPSCRKKGLHAHHPRDCLFYLRDCDRKRMQKLLQDNNVPFDTKDINNNKECQVMEQKETPNGLKDAPCGREVMLNCAGLCLLHYKEYLVNLVNTHGLDPADIFNAKELQICLMREDSNIEQGRGESEEVYRRKLLSEVKKIPLKRPGNRDVDMATDG